MAEGSSPNKSPVVGNIGHHAELVAEIRAMARFARNLNQAELPAVLEAIGEESTWNGLNEKLLNTAHQGLAQMVWPATPVGIVRVERISGDKSLWRYFVPVPLVGFLILAAIACLGATAGFFAAEPDFLKDGFAGTNVNDYFAVAFVISASGLGASFYTLFTALRYVNNRTYDPVRNSSYLARFVLGLVAGLIIVLVLFGNDTDLGVGTVGLAIIGGFSSDIVFRILTRLAQSVEFLVLGERGPAGGASDRPTR